MNLIVEGMNCRATVCPLGAASGWALRLVDIEDRQTLHLHATRSPKPAMPQLVLKTAAVHPELTGAGLGTVVEPFLELSLRGAPAAAEIDLARSTPFAWALEFEVHLSAGSVWRARAC